MKQVEYNFYLFLFIYFLQIFEWCHFVKTSGVMKDKLPFLLDLNEDSSNAQRTTQQQSLPDDQIEAMVERYVDIIPEFKQLLSIYNMEKETARRNRLLKSFPVFAEWKPRAGSSTEQPRAVVEGLIAEPTVLVYNEYTLDTKQHSRSSLYVSQEHPIKKASAVYYISSSTQASNSKNIQFGMIQRIYSHNFANKEFMWAAVKIYKKPQYDANNGLWYSSDLFQQKVHLDLLSSLSYPLTIAKDENSCVWFIDVDI